MFLLHLIYIFIQAQDLNIGKIYEDNEINTMLYSLELADVLKRQQYDRFEEIKTAYGITEASAKVIMMETSLHNFVDACIIAMEAIKNGDFEKCRLQCAIIDKFIDFVPKDSKVKVDGNRFDEEILNKVIMTYELMLESEASLGKSFDLISDKISLIRGIIQFDSEVKMADMQFFEGASGNDENEEAKAAASGEKTWAW
jgi:hypothetical protein